MINKSKKKRSPVQFTSRLMHLYHCNNFSNSCVGVIKVDQNIKINSVADSARRHFKKLAIKCSGSQKLKSVYVLFENYKVIEKLKNDICKKSKFMESNIIIHSLDFRRMINKRDDKLNMIESNITLYPTKKEKVDYCIGIIKCTSDSEARYTRLSCIDFFKEFNIDATVERKNVKILFKNNNIENIESSLVNEWGWKGNIAIDKNKKSFNCKRKKMTMIGDRHIKIYPCSNYENACVGIISVEKEKDIDSIRTAIKKSSSISENIVVTKKSCDLYILFVNYKDTASVKKDIGPLKNWPNNITVHKNDSKEFPKYVDISNMKKKNQSKSKISSMFNHQDHNNNSPNLHTNNNKRKRSENFNSNMSYDSLNDNRDVCNDEDIHTQSIKKYDGMSVLPPPSRFTNNNKNFSPATTYPYAMHSHSNIYDVSQRKNQTRSTQYHRGNDNNNPYYNIESSTVYIPNRNNNQSNLNIENITNNSTQRHSNAYNSNKKNTVNMQEQHTVDSNNHTNVYHPTIVQNNIYNHHYHYNGMNTANNNYYTQHTNQNRKTDDQNHISSIIPIQTSDYNNNNSERIGMMFSMNFDNQNGISNGQHYVHPSNSTIPINTTASILQTNNNNHNKTNMSNTTNRSQISPQITNDDGNMSTISGINSMNANWDNMNNNYYNRNNITNHQHHYHNNNSNPQGNDRNAAIRSYYGPHHYSYSIATGSASASRYTPYHHQTNVNNNSNTRATQSQQMDLPPMINNISELSHNQTNNHSNNHRNQIDNNASASMMNHSLPYPNNNNRNNINNNFNSTHNQNGISNNQNSVHPSNSTIPISHTASILQTRNNAHNNNHHNNTNMRNTTNRSQNPPQITDGNDTMSMMGGCNDNMSMFGGSTMGFNDNMSMNRDNSGIFHKLSTSPTLHTDHLNQTPLAPYIPQNTTLMPPNDDILAGTTVSNSNSRQNFGGTANFFQNTSNNNTNTRNTNNVAQQDDQSFHAAAYNANNL